MTAHKDIVQRVIESPRALVEMPRDIQLQKFIELRRKNLSYNEIGKIVGCSKQYVHQKLRDTEDFEGFTKDPALRYEILQHKILQTLDDESIKKINAYQRIIAVGVLEDKKRLLRNQSTENINISELRLSLEDIRRQKEEITARLKSLRDKKSQNSQGDSGGQKSLKDS
ncbi:MAG: hypothetical protein MRJ65_15550 [Candidatus Brocadiaceae bacterium]|nr:hypothetical protein [Candidatus Brocadiaceae bacterium]